MFTQVLPVQVTGGLVFVNSVHLFHSTMSVQQCQYNNIQSTPLLHKRWLTWAGGDWQRWGCQTRSWGRWRAGSWRQMCVRGRRRVPAGRCVTGTPPSCHCHPRHCAAAAVSTECLPPTPSPWCCGWTWGFYSRRGRIGITIIVTLWMNELMSELMSEWMTEWMNKLITLFENFMLQCCILFTRTHI